MNGVIATLAKAWRLSVPYFKERAKGELDFGLFVLRLQERWIGLGFVAIILAINVAQVTINVRLNSWNNEFYDALQTRNGDEFWRQLGIFTMLVAVYLVIYVYEVYLTSWLRIRWRRWMTDRFLDRWLDGANHYRLAAGGYPADNPDQRISEDINNFVTSTFSLTVSIFSTVLSLYAFTVVLWGISARFPYEIMGFNLANIPGYLVWAAVLYSVIGTVITHLIGRPLIRLNFQQQHVEADFRYSMMRLRENSEEIAFLHGETVEKKLMHGFFGKIVGNWYKLMNANRNLRAFSLLYDQASTVFPFIMLAPAYFVAGSTMQLGFLVQTSGAFGQVQGAFSFFVSAYGSIADWKAVLDRLTTFEAAMTLAETAARDSRVEIARGDAAAVTVDDADIGLPDGRTILTARGLSFAPGQSVLIAGPSGSGKTSLFRTIAGIWPFGRGRIRLPAGARLMALPQRAYLPSGSLRQALAYPHAPDAFDDATLRDVLRATGLGAMEDTLDDVGDGGPLSGRLSGGERQRVAIARAILARPDILLLDEATASLDEPAEAAIYRLLRERLPQATIISIGHRSSLDALHDRRIEVQRGVDGHNRLEPASVAVS